MNEYRLTQAAADDLTELFLYSFDAFGLSRAETYRDSLIQCFQRLADTPAMGRNADEFAIGARRHEHSHHIVFYDVHSPGILIIAIVHERSVRKLLG